MPRINGISPTVVKKLPLFQFFYKHHYMKLFVQNLFIQMKHPKPVPPTGVITDN
jgi:hypothetical protein